MVITDAAQKKLSKSYELYLRYNQFCGGGVHVNISTQQQEGVKMHQFKKSLCPSSRDGPEDSKTPPTFKVCMILSHVMAHSKKQCFDFPSLNLHDPIDDGHMRFSILMHPGHNII